MQCKVNIASLQPNRRVAAPKKVKTTIQSRKPLCSIQIHELILTGTFRFPFLIALLQKSIIEEVSTRQPSLNSTTKAAPAPLAAPQAICHNTSKLNTMSITYSEELITNPTSKRSFSAFDIFSTTVGILIVALVLLNIYLFVQFYLLKHKQANEIQLDRAILDKLVTDGLVLEKKHLNTLK